MRNDWIGMIVRNDIEWNAIERNAIKQGNIERNAVDKMLLNGSPSGHFDGILFNRKLFNVGALRATLMGFCLIENYLMWEPFGQL